MAEGVFRHMAEQAGIAPITVDSAGTSDFHIGHAPDRRAQSALRARGIDISRLRARQVSLEDFARFDYILAMDQMNLGDLQAMSPEDYPGTLALFLSFAPSLGVSEVPDPYYGKADGFEHVYSLIEAASRGLIEDIEKRYFSSAPLAASE